MDRARALLLVPALGWAAPLTAQTFADADSLLARRDTSGAIAVLEGMIKRHHRDAEAHFRAGVLYMARHVAGTELSPNRRKAEEHFRYATRFEPDSAKYWIALADLFRGEDMVTTRMQVRGLVGRARREAEESGDQARLADAAYRQARADWNTFATFGRRFRHQEASVPLSPLSRDADWNDIVQYFSERISRVPDAGAEYLDGAEEALHAVLGVRPLDLDAAGLLVVVFGERSRWEEAAGLTRRLVRLAPDSGRAWALHGLTMARTNRWKEATAAFGSALAAMTEAERAPFENLGQIMRQADRIRFAQMGRTERDQLDSIYWRVAQPLALAETNEVRAEFYARIVYAQHRWTDPWRGYRGIETDMGSVFVRYGPPDLETSSNWLYLKPRFLFSFYLAAGFSRARFSGESDSYFRQAQLASPARFDNIPIMRTLDTILVQTARFRGPGDSLAMLVVGAVPLRRMTDSIAVRDLPLVTGALVADDAGRELARDRQSGTITGTDADDLQYRTFRLQLVPGDYLLRVEAHLPSIDRGARAMHALAVAPIPRSGLALSDLLVAQRVAPRDSAAARWSDFLIEPNAGRFEPGEPVGLLWEIYNLTPDSTGAARYEVGLWITVEAIDRSKAGWFAALLGGLGDQMGLTAVYGDRVSLTYRRANTASPGAVQAEHLMVELRDAPKGRYLLEVIVQDLVTGQQATATRAFSIGTEPVTR
jgi:GWxTD domain-containing protein